MLSYGYRYLEDVIPSIKYQPPSTKSSKKESEEDNRVCREQLEDMGLSDQNIQAIRNISRSGRIDYQVTHIVQYESPYIDAEYNTANCCRSQSYHLHFN
jgi:hypothetical protein